jgi:hypothetical protein
MGYYYNVCDNGPGEEFILPPGPLASEEVFEEFNSPPAPKGEVFEPYAISTPSFKRVSSLEEFNSPLAPLASGEVFEKLNSPPTPKGEVFESYAISTPSFKRVSSKVLLFIILFIKSLYL